MKSLVEGMDSMFLSWDCSVIIAPVRVFYNEGQGFGDTARLVTCASTFWTDKALMLHEP